MRGCSQDHGCTLSVAWHLGARPFQVSCCRCLRMAAGPCVAPRLLQLLCLPCLHPGPCSGCRRCLGGGEPMSGSACAAAPPFAGCLGVPLSACPWVSGRGWQALPWHIQSQCPSLRARRVLLCLAVRPCGDQATSRSRWLCRSTCALSLRQRRAPSARMLRGRLGTRVSSACLAAFLGVVLSQRASLFLWCVRVLRQSLCSSFALGQL